MLRPICILFLAAASLCCVAHSAKADSILIIHSGVQDSESTEDFTKGVEGVLPDPLMTQVWLDAGKDDSEEYMDTALENLEFILKLSTPGGIICNGDAAFALYRKYGQELFPGIPAVFSGVLGYEDHMREECPIPGLRADYSGAETFELMLDLHPKARTIALIVDETPAGQRIRKQVEAAFKKHMDRVQLIIPGQEAGRAEGTDAKELLKIAEFMPQDSLILFGTFSRDKTGSLVNETELALELVARANAPVYVLSHDHYGTGAMGGVMPGPEAHGREAATLLKQLWDGADPVQLQVTLLGNSTYYNISGMERAGAEVTRIEGYEIMAEMRDKIVEAVTYALIILGAAILLGLIVAFVRHLRAKTKTK